jgi:hypothetical protein
MLDLDKIVGRLKNLGKHGNISQSECDTDGHLDWFDGELSDVRKYRYATPESRKNNLEWDLLNTDWILDKARARQDYAQNVYAALCNTKWQKLEILEILKDQTWSCSWRYAGGIVSGMRQEGDYMDWYCSGMGGIADYDAEAAEKFMKQHKFVPEGTVTDEIAADFRQLGWALKKT